MDEKKPPNAPAPQQDPATVARPAAVGGELDLEVEEIRRPERMKEGFVGQER
jgi:hypothetical protein